MRCTETIYMVDSVASQTPKLTSSRRQSSTADEEEAAAREAWRGYLMRNRSIIVDLFQGQLRSRLQCSQCGHRSVTFDPFMYLTVPIPRQPKAPAAAAAAAAVSGAHHPHISSSHLGSAHVRASVSNSSAAAGADGAGSAGSDATATATADVGVGDSASDHAGGSVPSVSAAAVAGRASPVTSPGSTSGSTGMVNGKQRL